MTDSQIAKTTYHERLYDERCGTCEHVTDWGGYWSCDNRGRDVAQYGYCDVWKERE